MIEGWKLVALGVLVALAHSSDCSAATPRSPGAWATKCIAGEDEFASNCNAEKSTEHWRIAMSTGDSQLFLNLSSEECPLALEQRSWWRDELAGLSPSKRKAVLEKALRHMRGSIMRRCQAASPEGIQLGDFPDIAVHGDP